MEYKKIISNQEIRLKLLKLFDFLPDRVMIKLQYRISQNRKLNLKNPKRFTEKLQWYKLYYRDPLMINCSDKYEVRNYVASKGLEEILVPLYGVYDSANDINFDVLPNKFVLKTNNGSHTNIICEDKSKLNYEETKKKLDEWLTTWNGKMGREWAYHGVKPKIICEEFLEKDKNNDLVDYKFFCFDGKPFSIYVIVERFIKSGLKLGIFDTEFRKIPYFRKDIAKLNEAIDPPKNYYDMVKIAEKLSEDFPHVRVDLYNVEGKIYFGELTFYTAGGYQKYDHDEFDYILGEKFTLPNAKRK